MSRPSTLYDYEDYAFISLDTLIEARALYADEWASGHIQSVDFFVEDAAELDGIVERAKDAASLDWDNYYVEANGRCTNESPERSRTPDRSSHGSWRSSPWRAQS